MNNHPWKEVGLDSICTKIDYGVTESAQDQAVGPKFLRITDIVDNSVDWSVVPYCRASGDTAVRARLDAGDLVFARTGATTGKSFLVESCPEGAVFASYLIRIRPDETIHSRYLSWFFHTPNYWAQISKESNGSGQPGVNSTKLRALRIPLPPLPEQKRIAAILDKADAIRRKRQQAIALTEEFLRSAFLDMFGDPVTNPKGWEIEALGIHLAFVTSGSRGWAKYYSDSGQRFIRSLDVRMNFVSDNDQVYVTAPAGAETERTRVQKGDVLLTITGSKIGRVAPVGDVGPAHISQHVAILRLKDGLRPKYLSMFLSLQCGGQRQIADIQYGQTKPGLNLDQIRSLRVPVPPVEVQRAFEECWSAHSRAVVSSRSQLVASHELFESLVQRAFRGEL